MKTKIDIRHSILPGSGLVQGLGLFALDAGLKMN
jgi:hypothetical protein